MEKGLSAAGIVTTGPPFVMLVYSSLDTGFPEEERSRDRDTALAVPGPGFIKKRYIYFAPGFDPGAAATTLSASTISGRISAGMPMTISPSSMPENFREPSQPSEKFTFPLR